MTDRHWLPETEGRLTLLMCLGSTEPATREQLECFIMTCGLMNYFEMRETLEHLVSSRLIAEKNDRAGVLLSLSEEGRQTLAFFTGRVPPSRRGRILSEAPAWQLRFRREQEAPAALVTREGCPTEMRLLAPTAVRRFCGLCWCCTHRRPTTGGSAGSRPPPSLPTRPPC